ncbi:MAG: hypothetical protein KKG59_01655 [Nanoarchaeota archaeon]|nr:hypothetical protein [Nanoarchaeota archaeon]
MKKLILLGIILAIATMIFTSCENTGQAFKSLDKGVDLSSDAEFELKCIEGGDCNLQEAITKLDGDQMTPEDINGTNITCDDVDFDGSGMIDLPDFSNFASWYNRATRCGPRNNWCGTCDYDHSGMVNLIDFSIFASWWGRYCSDSCEDSDGGIEYEIWGEVSGLENGEYYHIPDGCTPHDPIYQNERYCDGVSPMTDSHTCDIMCYNGECINDFGVCIDSDGSDSYNRGKVNGWYIALNGTNTTYDIWDHCGANAVVEMLCDYPNPTYDIIECAYGCENGACLEMEIQCEDTDGGNYPLVAGLMTVTNGTNVTERPDECQEEHVVKEYYCHEILGPYSEVHDCTQIGTDYTCMLNDNGWAYCAENTTNETNYPPVIEEINWIYILPEVIKFMATVTDENGDDEIVQVDFNIDYPGYHFDYADWDYPYQFNWNQTNYTGWANINARASDGIEWGEWFEATFWANGTNSTS